MKKFQSYDQFEAELKKESISEIDLDKVKAKVIGLDDSHRRAFSNRRKMILVIAVVIFTLGFGTVAVAIYNGWQLKNKKGDVVLNYTKGEMPEFSRMLRGWDARLKFFEIEDETLANLAPREMAYFLVVKEYEICKNFVVLQKEEKLSDLKKLKESTTTEFKVPEYLPDSYQFEYGIVTFKEEGEDEKIGEALYQTAKKTGKDYIIKKGKLTKEAKNIMLKYINKDGYKLTINIGDKNDMKAFDYHLTTIEKFTVSEKEILYMSTTWPDTDSYVFVDEAASQSLTYSITNRGMNQVFVWDSDKTSLALPKEEAAKMIKSFK